MKKAILYLRFSSIEQAEKNEGFEKQYEVAEKYCLENGIEIVRTFSEVSRNRPWERYYFDKAMRVAKELNGYLSYFLVMDYSRISRSCTEFMEIKNELRSYGIGILPIASDTYANMEAHFTKLNSTK